MEPVKKHDGVQNGFCQGSWDLQIKITIIGSGTSYPLDRHNCEFLSRATQVVLESLIFFFFNNLIQNKYINL